MKGVYHKHGAYYTVVRNRWIRIGATLDEAEKAKRAIDDDRRAMKAAGTTDAHGMLRSLYTKSKLRARGGSRRRPINFNLAFEDVEEMFREQGGLCAVSGLPFDITLDPASGHRLFAPSIDRINSKMGYTRDNCRIVCVSVNFAMNQYGDTVLKKIARAVRKNIDTSLDVR